MKACLEHIFTTTHVFVSFLYLIQTAAHYICCLRQVAITVNVKSLKQVMLNAKQIAVLYSSIIKNF